MRVLMFFKKSLPKAPWLGRDGHRMVYFYDQTLFGRQANGQREDGHGFRHSICGLIQKSNRYGVLWIH